MPISDERKEYINKYHRENIKAIKISVHPDEYAEFDRYVRSLGVSKAVYLEGLIDADRVARGLAPIFPRHK